MPYTLLGEHPDGGLAQSGTAYVRDLGQAHPRPARLAMSDCARMALDGRCACRDAHKTVDRSIPTCALRYALAARLIASETTGLK